MVRTILLIVVILLILGLLPGLGFHGLGYWPSGGLGLVLLILIILVIAGRL